MYSIRRFYGLACQENYVVPTIREVLMRHKKTWRSRKQNLLSGGYLCDICKEALTIKHLRSH